MTLRDLYCYSDERQSFTVVAETDYLAFNENTKPLFTGLLTDCSTDYMDEIVSRFWAVDNKIIVLICI